MQQASGQGVVQWTGFFLYFKKRGPPLLSVALQPPSVTL